MGPRSPTYPGVLLNKCLRVIVTLWGISVQIHGPVGDNLIQTTIQNIQASITRYLRNSTVRECGHLDPQTAETLVKGILRGNPVRKCGQRVNCALATGLYIVSRPGFYSR